MPNANISNGEPTRIESILRRMGIVKPQEFIPRIKKLEKFLGKEVETLPELALRFLLSFEEVSTVIPGTRKVKNVEANASVSDGKKLSKELMRELKKHIWERNFYVDFDPSLEKDGYIEK